MSTLAPGLTDRAAFIGKTGSGKTTLARVLLQSRPVVVAYDVKGMLYWPGYVRLTTLRECIAGIDKHPHIIYAPNHEELLDQETINNFFKWIYLRKYTTVYIDEVYSVCTRGGDIPPFYHAILTRGRELGISTFSATQRPKKIPMVVLSESEHYYVFQLRLEEDRKRIREIVDVSDNKLKELRDHLFLYADAGGVTVGPFALKL